jgi:WD40 repeat protein
MSIRDCPYVGLQPYTEQDREFFFGREKEERVVVSNLFAAALTVLYGASGVGKSSVLRAGVMPLAGSSPATVALYFNEWQDRSFLAALKTALVAEAQARYPAADRIDATLPLDEILARIAMTHDVSSVLVLDQFEEYFLYHPESGGNSRFEAELASAVNREECRAGILISLRDDWLSRLDRFSGRIPALLANTLRLDHLSDKAASDAIREPLRLHHEKFPEQFGPTQVEDEAVAEILRQVRAGEVVLSESGGVGQAKGREEKQQIETAFLQLVLTRLWNEEKAAGSPRMRLATLERLGGARQIVRAHLDGVMAELSGDEQESCARMFQYLVTPRGAKIAHETADLVAFAERPAGQTTPVLETLNRRRVLRRISPPERYEIFHDVLAPAVLDWRAKYVQGREQAELQRRAAEQERQARKFRRLSTVLAGLALVVIVMMFLLGMWSRRLAVSEEAAREAQRKAEKSAEDARIALERAEQSAVAEKAATSKAEVEARQALAHKLAGAARSTHGSETGILFALAAIETTRFADGTVLPAALDALRRAVPAPPVPLARPGHEKVADIAISEATNRVATIGSGILALWDAATGEQVWSLESGCTRDLQFSMDGAVVACLGPFEIPVVDAKSGKTLISFSRVEVTGSRGIEPERLLLDHAGRQVAVHSKANAGEWRILNIANRTAPLRVAGLAGGFSQDGRRFAVVTRSAVEVWSTLEETRLAKFQPGVAPRQVAVSADGQLIAVPLGFADSSPNPLPWKATTDGDVQMLITGGNSVAISPDGKIIAFASFRGTWRISLWAFDSGRLIRTISFKNPLSRDHPPDLQFSSDGRILIASIAADRYSSCFGDVASGKEMNCHSSDIWKASRAAGTAAAWNSPNATVYDLSKNEAVSQFLVRRDEQVLSAAFSADVKRVVTGSELTARIWDAESGRGLFNLNGHHTAVDAVGFSPDGRLVATGATDGRAKLWDSSTGRELHTLSGHRARILGAAFRPDSKVLATASYDLTAKFWDTASGKETLLGSPIRGPASLFSIAFSRDSMHIATGAATLVRMWARDGAPEKAPTGSLGGIVQGLSFGFGNVLAAATQSGTFLGEPSGAWRKLPGSGGNPPAPRSLGVAFSRDGTQLVGGGDGDTVRLWDVTSGREAAVFYSHAGPILAATFSPDERFVLAIDAKWNVYRHPLRIDDLVAQARAAVKRQLTQEECSRYLQQPCPAIQAADR